MDRAGVKELQASKSVLTHGNNVLLVKQLGEKLVLSLVGSQTLTSGTKASKVVGKTKDGLSSMFAITEIGQYTTMKEVYDAVKNMGLLENTLSAYSMPVLIMTHY